MKNTIKDFRGIFAVIFSIGLISCMPIGRTEIAEKDSLDTLENNEHLQFHVMAGKKYQLCQDYSEMLNSANYKKPELCERNVASGFSKFKSLEWDSVTDKEKIERLVLESIRLRNLWINQRFFERQATKARDQMRKNIYPEVYQTRADVDSDGILENVYVFISKLDKDIKPVCQDFKSYLIIPDDGSDFWAYKKPGIYRFYNGSVTLFLYDGRIYQDVWLGENSEFNLIVNEASGIPNHVCGINVINGDKE